MLFGNISMSDFDKTVVVNFDAVDSAEKCPVCNITLVPDEKQSGLLRCPVCRYAKVQRIEIAPGQTLGNKYRILSQLGGGGYGDIFICHPLTDPTLRYVLKILRTGNRTSQKRFRREAAILAEISGNERIAKIIDFWESGSDTFIVMEYIRGHNLKQLILEYQMDERAILQIAKEAVHALQDIWENYNIIHRDIKPENIMLNEKFHLKLLDFGLSKQCTEEDSTNITLEKSSLGTPGFMSPEQFTDFKHVDFRSDIFSLGATLFFLLTGTPPFKGSTLMDIFKDTQRNAPPPVKSFQGKCSPGCMTLIRRMMEFEPERRHSSYAELLQEIRELLN